MAHAVNPQEAAVSLNPATGEEIRRYPYEDEADLNRALRLMEAGFEQWRASSADVRAQTLSNMAAALRRNLEPLALIATREMGKPISQSRAEVEKCAAVCDWYAEHGPAMLADERTSVADDKAYVSYLPIGGVLAVMPWNFPYWQVMRGAIPIILAGNAYVLKHAPNVMGCAYALKEIWAEAALPDGVFSVANVSNELVSKAILDRRIAAVTVTGSVRAGSAIAAQAGAALKKSVLELGGSDPFIVLADADLEGAVRAAVVGRFQNTGQVCIAAKRIILERPIQQAFTERFMAAVQELKVGDPEEADSYFGPMARYDLRDELHGQVRATTEQGAKVLMGGAKLDGPGNFYAPTILSEVVPGMVAFDQEIFGPVASLISADNASHAIELANASEFGLSGAIWTGDDSNARAFAREIQTGGIFVNGFSASDPRVPIGGVKKSGYGRELSHFGMREFMNAQTVWFDRV
ncbi:aldehyde dehydrogenase (NAD) family protein [Caballeronia pedi]|uniref:Aldehyde dehydrogenase (NAD) family protein n=1 Tax=Caballeronia pedi TaxID=1777141 RepID=A0A158E687_9BURK|nr:aldehyde dehydrogenase family protein [Caballeronia pedi]SAL02395.1 aldehyde dehydrogenase (NAD) family protein [Caballeronia pedi]